MSSCVANRPLPSSLLTYSQNCTKLREFSEEFSQEFYNIVFKSFDLDAENGIIVGKEFAPNVCMENSLGEID